MTAITERDASQLVCPFQTADDGTTRHCIGSKCMLWREREEDNPTLTEQIALRDLQVRPPSMFEAALDPYERGRDLARRIRDSAQAHADARWPGRVRAISISGSPEHPVVKAALQVEARRGHCGAHAA